MRFLCRAVALCAASGLASAAAIVSRENYGTWNVHIQPPTCHPTYGCVQVFQIDGEGDPATGRPAMTFASCAIGGGCSVDINQWGSLLYTLINRVDDPETELTITQGYWDDTNEYNATGSIPFSGDSGDYTMIITSVTSAPL
ncbi:hypothetical protein F4777DRAFT_582152 [Nemania sp. FL0916]|nr:hypothetical protein F4777DRAFT_582152 [Nemania sp. FL0916]